MSTEDITFDAAVWEHLAKGSKESPYSRKHPFLKCRNDKYKVNLMYCKEPERIEVYYHADLAYRLLGSIRPGEHFTFDQVTPYKGESVVAKVRSAVDESNQAMRDFIDKNEHRQRPNTRQASVSSLGSF